MVKLGRDNFLCYGLVFVMHWPQVLFADFVTDLHVQEPRKEHTPPKAKIEKKPIVSQENPTRKKKPASPQKNEEPIDFKADGMTAYKLEGLIKLRENVFVQQGQMSIVADFGEILASKEGQSPEKIKAWGHVHIKTQELESGRIVTAKSDHAEYFVKEKLIVMQGNATIVRGGDTLSGTVMRYFIEKEEAEVSKVSGVLTSQKNNE